MPKLYHFTIEGSGAGGQSWKATGQITCEFHDSFNAAMLQAFDQLTEGKAVYGNPGVGCTGPYDIHKLLIEQEKQ